MANGCATVSPVIKLYVSFHQGDGRTGKMRREDVEGIQERQERQRWGREILYLMHPPCDFLPLSNLFLSSVQTTWHLVALKFYWREINWPKNGGASLISLNMLFAPYSHAVSLIFSSFHSRFHSLHFSPLLPPPCSCLCLPHPPLTEYWLTNSFHICFCFLTPSLSLPHLCLLIPPLHLLSSGTCISLQVLQGTQRGAVKAAASPRTAPSLLAKRRASEGQQHWTLWHSSHQLIVCAS